MNFNFEFLDSYIQERMCVNKEGTRFVSMVFIKLNGTPFDDHTFVGNAYCHPDDYFSEFSGCKIAEMRAQRSALKYILKYQKKDFHKLENFIKACEQYKNFDKESPSAKCMYRQLNRYKKDIEKIKNIIKNNEKCEKEYIKNLDKLNKSAKED